MTDRELLRECYDQLRILFNAEVPLVKALKERLAQPEPEPVAWVYQHEDTGLTMCVLVQQVDSGFEKNNPRWQKIAPLYTAPPQREWQGLTDEEIRNEAKNHVFDESFFSGAVWARGKIMGKNHG